MRRFPKGRLGGRLAASLGMGGGWTVVLGFGLCCRRQVCRGSRPSDGRQESCRYAWRLRNARARIGPSKHRTPRDVICSEWPDAAKTPPCCLCCADDSTSVLPRLPAEDAGTWTLFAPRASEHSVLAAVEGWPLIN